MLSCSASIATCVRFKYLMAYVDPKEYLYGQPDMGTWTGLETTLGMIAGSLPALRPLFRHVPLLSGTTKASRKRTGEPGLAYKLQSFGKAKKQNKTESTDIITYMGHAIHVSAGKDVERGVQEDSASQTHILSEDRHDILMETRVEVKSEREATSQETDRRAAS
jgi:hypothetical protein